MGDFVPVSELHKARKPAFSLHWFNYGLIALLAVGWFILMAIRMRAQGVGFVSPNGFGRIAGMFVGTILISGLLAYVAYFAARRSSRVGNIVFGLCMVLFGVDNSAGLLMQLSGGGGQMREAVATLKENKLADYKQYQETGEVPKLDDRLAKISGAVDGLASTGAKGAAAGRVLSKMMSMVKEQGTPVEEAVNKAKELPSIDQVKSPETLDTWISTYTEMRDINRSFITFYDSLPAKLDDLYKAENFSAAERQELLRSMKANLHFEEHRQYRESIIRFCDDAIAYAAFSKEHWGSWGWDTSEEMVVFNEGVSDEVLERYVGIATAFGDSAEDMVAEEEEFVKLSLR